MEPRRRTTVDGMEITVAGIPDGVTVSAETVVPREYNHEVFKIVGSKKIVFAVDINLSDGADEWQPESGKSVTVSLDAEALGLKDGDKIGILHEHDGGVKKLGSCTVEEGKLTFATDGFSTFYGYTVDFEYDGTWYSIGGGSGIYLCDLFAQLGINRDTSDIKSVEFTDDSLLEVSEEIVDEYTGDTEWYIRSLEAFDTEEIMTITFENGDEIVINVYDANYTTITADKTLNDKDTIEGKVAIKNNITLTVNGTVTLNGEITIEKGATLTITGSGTLKRGSTNTGNLFDVQGKLVIKGENIILDGGAEWTTRDVAESTRKTLQVTKGAEVTGAAIYLRDGDAANGNGIVDLQNITIQNFYTKNHSPNQASVIDSEGTTVKTDGDYKGKYTQYSRVTMKNVTVQTCATMGDRSIMLFDECVATLTNCKFLNNYSGNRYGGTLKGGGQTHFCQLTMTNCEASGNYSSGWGGVLLWAANNICKIDDKAETSKAVINNCNFHDNTARYLGGAISNEAVMEIQNTTLTENIAMAGGGIATFPFTRTEDNGSTGDQACGLTLGNGNIIEKNDARATSTFIPFSKNTNEVDGDDCKPIANKITYTGGGGGVWCYMDKESWECSLVIGAGNTITENTAANAGGGVYIQHVKGTATTLSITGASITKNTAVNGGGVAAKDANVTITSGEISKNTASENGGGIYVQKDSTNASAQCSVSVSGTGTVSNNTSANGGGIYIDGGNLSVDGGIISGNHAKGTFDGDTAKNAEAGVGGGIYLNKGKFTMAAGNNVGLHSNIADVAANDAYATGNTTELSLPDVKNMQLAGWNGTGNPTGWYADYKEGDTSFPTNVITSNPGRYDYYDKDKMEVTFDMLNGNKTTYYCLTIGTPHSGYGKLSITKEVDSPAQEDQTFIFRITGTTSKESQAYDLTVTLLLKAGAKSATITIDHIPDGTYTITEQTNWSWRYDQTSSTIYSKNGSVIPGKNFTVNETNPEWLAEILNKRSRDHWLSGDCYCKNLFKNNSIEKIGSDVTSGLKQKGGSV